MTWPKDPSFRRYTYTVNINMGVSKNNGTPQIIHFNRVYHYKPSILGTPIFGNIHMFHKFMFLSEWDDEDGDWHGNTVYVYLGNPRHESWFHQWRKNLISLQQQKVHGVMELTVFLEVFFIYIFRVCLRDDMENLQNGEWFGRQDNILNKTVLNFEIVVRETGVLWEELVGLSVETR